MESTLKRQIHSLNTHCLKGDKEWGRTVVELLLAIPHDKLEMRQLHNMLVDLPVDQLEALISSVLSYWEQDPELAHQQIHEYLEFKELVGKPSALTCQQIAENITARIIVILSDIRLVERVIHHGIILTQDSYPSDTVFAMRRAVTEAIRLQDIVKQVSLLDALAESIDASHERLFDSKGFSLN